MRRWNIPALIALVAVCEGLWLLHTGAVVSAVIALVLLLAVAAALSPLAFPGAGPDEGARAVIYWRPGCQYCLWLRWSLGRRARRARWVDIWADEDARAYVRSVNDGNETVPTVVIDGQARTNPDVRWVRHALAEL